MESKIITINVALKLSKTEILTLVSGSFDLLHSGHLYLFDKSHEVDINSRLIVLIMDDANIKRRKGENRPINNLELRIKELQKISEIDYILPWTEPWEKIAEFVTKLNPAYFVAVDGDPGIESKRNAIELGGGKFIVIKRLPGFSTSKILLSRKLNK